MIKVYKKWIEQYFADEEAITLLTMLLAGLLVVLYAGNIVAPIIASVIIAYLLQGLVQLFSRWLPHTLSVTLTLVLFAGGFCAAILLLIPIIGRQISTLLNQLPLITGKFEALLVAIEQKYPGVLSPQQTQELMEYAELKAGIWGDAIFTFCLAFIPNLFAIMVYGVMIPLMVFFLLKDKDMIVGWLTRFLPDNRPMMQMVWQEMNRQVANYARGKAIEVLLVGVVTYITFRLMGLNYAALLGLFVGLSVIIPYVGAVVVTVPVVVVAYMQFGTSDLFGYVVLAYAIIQAVDGYVLVPLLFSEAVNMHPLAIIMAVLVFGGLWGLWGVFFAIPLATLIKALLVAWPRGVMVKQESSCVSQ